jgi:hypothetical protein
MPEYYISKVPTTKDEKVTFTITKFEGDPEPENVYTVVWNLRQDIMQCTCPNKRRGAHIEDKHCKYVRTWLAAGEPTTPIIPGEGVL